ncbi:MAG: hypothetical protein WCG47_23470, partial [Dermatophilaceae bacterium]
AYTDVARARPASDGRRHPRSQRNIEAWLDRLRTKVIWLVEGHVSDASIACALSVMGAREGGDA